MPYLNEQYLNHMAYAKIECTWRIVCTVSNIPELIPHLPALGRIKLHYDQSRAAIQYYNALCRAAEVACTITELCALPPTLGAIGCRCIALVAPREGRLISSRLCGVFISSHGCGATAYRWNCPRHYCGVSNRLMATLWYSIDEKITTRSSWRDFVLRSNRVLSMKLAERGCFYMNIWLHELFADLFTYLFNVLPPFQYHSWWEPVKFHFIRFYSISAHVETFLSHQSTCT